MTSVKLAKAHSWHDIDWKSIYQRIGKIQEDIVSAYESSEMKRVYELQNKLVMSWEACALAVRRVSTSSGSKTAGIDGIIWDSPKKRYEAINLIRDLAVNSKNYKAKPVRRVYIPKPGTTEQRPLGIPTMIDRGLQALYHLGVDPVVECMSDRDSYGFRPYRSAQDAIARLRTLLDKQNSAEWILEADIMKCFDKRNHEFLLNHTPIFDKRVLEEWLKSGIWDREQFYESEEGTPQGGVISPLLCNVALNGIESHLKDWVKTRHKRKDFNPKLHIIRYADDLVVLGGKELIVLESKEKLTEFLGIRGLSLKESKTKTLHIREGFDFLGFSIQRKALVQTLNTKGKQNSVLIIKPSRRAEERLKDRVREVTSDYGRPIESIIKELNPVLRGWSEYYRISYHSLDRFQKLGSYVWMRMWIWARRRHSERTAKELISFYTVKDAANKWTFGKSEKEKLFNLSEVTSWKIFPIKFDLNPYLEINREYYQKRQEKRILAKFRALIYKNHQHICPECGESLHNGEGVELHHIKPQREGGKWEVNNVVPLHQICHQKRTQKENLKEKAVT